MEDAVVYSAPLPGWRRERERENERKERERENERKEREKENERGREGEGE